MAESCAAETSVIVEDELQELLTRLGVLSEDTEHGAGDGLAGHLLHPSHHHAHVAATETAEVKTAAAAGPPPLRKTVTISASCSLDLGVGGIISAFCGNLTLNYCPGAKFQLTWPE